MPNRLGRGMRGGVERGRKQGTREENAHSGVSVWKRRPPGGGGAGAPDSQVYG